MKIDWRRIVIEAMAIVVSILLAFGIDAWWDERQERQEERRLLQSLQAEFTATRRLLEDALADHRRVRDQAISLTHFGMSGGTLPPPVFEQPVQLVNVLTDVITFHPKTGALDGALASGHLDLITNYALRDALAGWPRTFAEFLEQQTLLWNLSEEARSVLAQSVPMAERLLAAPVMGPERASREWDLPPDFMRFLTSQVGQNLAAMRARAEALYVRDGETFMAEVDRLLAMIGMELG
jgi:hypothetical protein